MELKHLRYFVLVAELQHVTQAAEQLMVSQPFLTKIIKQLEEELGVDLFDHVGRKIQLNEFGNAYYVRAKNILRELENAQVELNEMSGRMTHTVSMFTNVSLYMPELLAKFHTFFPGLTIIQTSAKRNRIREALQTGLTDYALCAPPLEENEEFGIKTENVFKEDAYVLFSPHYPLRSRETVHISELHNQNFITSQTGYGMRDMMDHFFSQKSVQPRIVIETSDTASTANYVNAGLGFACLAQSIVDTNPALRKECATLTGINCESYIALSWNEKQYKTKAHMVFHEFVKDYFKSHGKRKG